MNATDPGIRKAAVFIAALDCPAADALLDRLPDAQARRVRDAVVALREVGAGEQRRVRDEFLRERSVAPPADAGGIELDGGPAGADAGTRSNPARGCEAETDGNRPPFAFLSEAAGGDLAKALQSERPQTIALVLAHLPPHRASEVLARLDPAGQAEVIRRLANFEEADPGIVREVEQTLQSRVARQWGIRPNRVVGMKAVQEILEVGEPGLGRTIAETLGTGGKGRPERAAEPALRFEELPRLDSGSLAGLFRTAGGPLAATALLGAPAALVRRVLDGLPREHSRWLRRTLDEPGPVRLRDVEEARRRIAQLATELQREGRLEVGPAESRMALTG